MMEVFKIVWAAWLTLSLIFNISLTWTLSYTLPNSHHEVWIVDSEFKCSVWLNEETEEGQPPAWCGIFLVRARKGGGGLLVPQSSQIHGQTQVSETQQAYSVWTKSDLWDSVLGYLNLVPHAGYKESMQTENLGDVLSPLPLHKTEIGASTPSEYHLSLSC